MELTTDSIAVLLQDLVVLALAFAVAVATASGARNVVQSLLNATLELAIRRYASGYFEDSVSLQIGFNYLTLCNLKLSRFILDMLNGGCHDSCHFEIVKVGSIRIQLFPYILAEIKDVDVRMFALPPDEWSVESVLQAMRSTRSDLFDVLTDRIQWKRKNKKIIAVIFPLQTFFLAIVDLVLSSARVNMFNICVAYRVNRRLDLEPSSIAAIIGELRVTPASFSTEYFFSPMMKMHYYIKDVSLFCQPVGGAPIDPPLLEPALVSGSIALPKILSQMIRAEPLESKYGHLDVTAEHLVVHGTLQNLISLSDFSILIDTYRKWYAAVEKTFIESRGTTEDVMFTYITAYLKYTSERSPHKRSELKKLYHSLEERLCDDDIRLSRSLVLGWYATDVLLLKKFRDDKNFQLYETFKSNDAKMVEYKTILKVKYENELLSFKELRKMKVDICAGSIFLNFPCFDAVSADAIRGRSPSSIHPHRILRRTTMWLHDTRMHVTEPIVKMSETFDEPRVLRGTIRRMVLGNTNVSGEQHSPVGINEVTANIPLFDRIEFITADKKKLLSAGLESDIDPTNMIVFNVIENIWNHEVTVSAELSNAVFVPNALHLFDFAEYAILAIEDITHVYEYYVGESQLPSEVMSLPALPASLMKGETLNIDVAGKSVCVMFTDQGVNTLAVPQCLVLRLDAIAKISSSVTMEYIEAKLPKLKLLTCEKLPSFYRPGGDESCAAVRQFMVCVCPSATHIQYSTLSFAYRLVKKKDIPRPIISPDVPEEDIIRLHTPGSVGTKQSRRFAPKENSVGNLTDRVDSWRWNEGGAKISTGEDSKKDIESVMMLNRDISCLASPIVVCISESESRILVQWCKHSVSAVFPQLLGDSKGKKAFASDRISDISLSKSVRAAMRAERLKQDEELYLEVKFRKFDLSGDGYLEPCELKAIISKILTPLHLLQHELEQKIEDILFVLDFDLDGRISFAEFRKNLISTERNYFINKGNINISAGEMIGSEVPDYITKGAHLDSTASRKLWDLIEREMGILYSDRNLGGKPPHVVQSMLIRLCGDKTLARSVWENVIRPNIREAEHNPYPYPWIVTDDEEIGNAVDFGALSREFLSKPKSNLASAVPDIDTTDLIVCSFTRIHVQISTLAVNIVDNFLGPSVPRFQFMLNELSIAGEILNEGIRPHWSSVSKDAVGVVSKLSVQSKFFNSLVQEHEPILEPWEMTCIVRKEEINGYLDCLVKGDFLNISLSTACLQTMASTVMNMFGGSPMPDRKSTESGSPAFSATEGLDEEQMVRMTKFDVAKNMRDHYCLVKNLSGCPLGFTVSAPHVFQSGTEIFVKQDSARYITIPLLNASIQLHNPLKGSNFAHLFVNTYLDDVNVNYVQNKPVALHVLALNSIAIYPDSRAESALAYHEKSSPALILDMETEGLKDETNRSYYNNSTLTARSNVKIRNFTNHDMWIRLLIEDLTENNSSRVDTMIAVNDVFYLPLQYVSFLGSLQLSLKQAGENIDFVNWMNLVNVEQLLLHQSRVQQKYAENSPFFYSAHSFHMLNTMAVCGTNYPLYDHTIDIISGVRVINALPYTIALKTRVDVGGANTSNLQQTASHHVFVAKPGEMFWLPVVNNKQVKLRLNIHTVSASKKLTDKNFGASHLKWSEIVSFNTTIMNSEIPVVLPSSAHMASIRCTLMLTKDLASLDSGTDIHTAPAMYIYSEIWVQNNSSIPLRYKFNKGGLERHVTIAEDSRIALDPGADVLQPLQHEESNVAMKPEHGQNLLGPILSPGGTKYVYVQEWKECEPREDSAALREFKSLVHVLPKKSTHTFWSDGLTLVNGHTGEIRTGNVWLGYLVRQCTGIFKKSKVVTITPRYVIQNKTSVPIRIFTTLVSRMSFTAKGKIRETDLVWGQAEASRKAHSPLELVESCDSAISNPPMQQYSYETQRSHELDIEAMRFAEAVLEKRRKRKSSMLRHVGATKGVSKGKLEETKIRMNDVAHSLEQDEPSAGQRSPHAGEYASLAPSDSAVMYSFGEETSLPKLFTQSMCISVGGENDTSKGYLLLKLCSASNLAVANSNGFSDPFCNIVWQGEHLFRTREQKNTLDPQWGESFILTLPKEDLSSLELRIEVMDHNISRQNTFLGQVTLRSHELLYSGGEELCLDLCEAPGSGNKGILVSGNVIFSVTPVSRRDNHPWTPPLRLDIPGVEYISARMTNGYSKLLSASVRSSGPVLIVSLCEQTKEALPAFRIENRTPDFRLRFRQHQTDKIDYVRRTLRPAEGCYYGWDDPNLPHAIELVIVDSNDVQSMPVVYKLDSIDEYLPPISTSGLSTKSQTIQVKIHIRGHIRVLTVNAGAVQNSEYDTDDSMGICAGYMLHASIDISFRGLSVAAIDDTPTELFNFVIEGVRVTSLAQNPMWTASILHVQLDNMMEKSKYPVMICPLDSGLNSERNPHFFQLGGGPIPLIEFNFEPDLYAPVITDATIIRAFELRVRPLNVIVDLNFIVRLVKAMITRRISGTFMLLCELLFSRNLNCDTLRDFLVNATPFPKSEHVYSTVFIKSMILHSVSLQILLSIKMDKMEMDEDRDLSTLTEHSRTVRYLVEMSRSITAINPKFEFFGVKLENAFDRLDAICWRIAFIYISQAILQSYKIFGSMDAIGDPVGVIKGLSSSLKAFVVHSGLELSGQTPFRAEGLKHLAQGIIGSPFGSLSKVSRGVGQLLGNISHVDIDLGQESAPAHIGEGILQAGKVLTETIQHGVVNVVKHPYKGIQEGNVLHTVRGVALGVLGLVLSPAIGTFGAVTKITQSIDSTTHVFDKQLTGRMRPSRPLFINPIVAPLQNTVVFKSFTFCIEGVHMALLSRFPKHFACVTVQYGAKYFSTTVMSCASMITWNGSDSVFYFPAKPLGDSFKPKKLIFKLKLMESASTHVGKGVTIARAEIHPLEMSGSLTKCEGPVCDEYDCGDSVLSSSFTEDDTKYFSKGTDERSYVTSSELSVSAHGPEKISKLRYNISSFTRRALAQRGTKKLPEEFTSNHKNVVLDSVGSRFTSSNNGFGTQESRDETVSAANSLNAPRLSIVTGATFPQLLPGSGLIFRSLPPLSTDENANVFKLALVVATDEIDDALQSDSMVSGSQSDNDLYPDEDLSSCLLFISGSYISAIPNSVKYANTMPSNSRPLDGDDIFVPVAESQDRID